MTAQLMELGLTFSQVLTVYFLIFAFMTYVVTLSIIKKICFDNGVSIEGINVHGSSKGGYVTYEMVEMGGEM